MLSLSFEFKLSSLSGIANLISAACNSWIPQANLNVVLDFVNTKICSHYVMLYSYLKVLLVIRTHTEVQNELGFT